MNAEQTRLENQRTGKENWRQWGPYLSERAWGSVREDYSADGEAWQYFEHDHARSRAYRWNEDGMAGISDEEQRLCLAIALWNGRDPILKERMFGLTGSQGNHGEDVKEYFFYLDATPSHSFMRYLYKYPQSEFPYSWLVEENRRRSRRDPPFNLLDTGVFQENRYWDVEVTYAKESPDKIVMQITASNRGSERAVLHLLPTLWFRNTWSWDAKEQQKPILKADDPGNAAWAVQAEHSTLGAHILYGKEKAEGLYTENETNTERLFGTPSASPYVKDAFHRRVVRGEPDAVNPDQLGTKFAAWHVVECAPGKSASLTLVLSSRPLSKPFAEADTTVRRRRKEADEFYGALLPGATDEDALIFRQALAGMIWSKQFYHYQVARWIDGDQLPPPESRRNGRNRNWRHFKLAHVISMPDKWEYPWFAAWDLAYHCIALSLVDVDFAKEQLELLLDWERLHPNGQIPAYEWSFEDVNPPVHATAILEVFRAERAQRGEGDLKFLRRVFNKLVMNYAWWLNRKDSDGQNVFEGGFMGLDNISVYDRSQPLPAGYRLKQADATGWMAMFSLNMTAIALELAIEHSEYEDMAIQCYQQFLAIANAIAGHASSKLAIWDAKTGFFKDLMTSPDGQCHHIDVYSYVGVIPLFACEIVPPHLLNGLPRFKAMIDSHMGGIFDGHVICECPFHTNDLGERLLSLVNHTMLPRIITRVLDDTGFLANHGVRSLSRVHAEHRDLGTIPGLGMVLIEYEPGESTSGLFGGNSNWRGPIWMPINYSLLYTLGKFYRYLGPNFKVVVPWVKDRVFDLAEARELISERLIDLFRRSEQGLVPAFPEDSPFQHDPHWKDLRLFYEYFHGETGLGLGASHQTGWTGLVANLIKQHYDYLTTESEIRTKVVWPSGVEEVEQ